MVSFQKLTFFLMALSGLAFAQKTVVNGEKPKGQAMAIEFTEDLRISPDKGGDEFIWSGSGLNVEVNEKGHMFVVDTGGNRVVEFDAAGKLVKAHGQKGPGPGEFQALSTLTKTKDGFVAFDSLQGNSRFHYFDKDFKFIRMETPKDRSKIFQFAAFSPAGDNFVSLYMVPSADQKQDMVASSIVAPDFSVKLPIADIKVNGFDGSQAGNPEWWSTFLASWFKMGVDGMGLGEYAPDGTLFTAKTNEYMVTKYGADMKPQLTIKREVKPIGQSQEEITAFAEPMREDILGKLPPQLQQIVSTSVVAKAVELAGFPPRKAPIFGLVPMDNGQLLVVHNYSPLTGVSSGDLFDKDGNFLGSSKLPKLKVSLFGALFGSPVKLKFRKGFAYAVEYSANDEYEVVRYKYKVVPAK